MAQTYRNSQKGLLHTFRLQEGLGSAQPLLLVGMHQRGELLAAKKTSLCRGPRNQIHIRILDSGSKGHSKGGIPAIMVCRILGFMWSCGPLLLLNRSSGEVTSVT